MDTKAEEKYKRLKKNLNKVLNENDQLKYNNEKLQTKIDHYKKRLRYLKHERDILIEKIQQFESDSESISEISEKSDGSDVESDESKRNHHKNKNEQTEYSSSSKRKGRSKRKRGGNSIRRAQHVDTDENGNAILPISLGVMTLHNLGTVVYDRDSFHNERYIFPVGYTLTRRYFSMVKSDIYVNYKCVVKDGGNTPIFEVTPEDAIDKKTSATSPTGAWISIVKAVNEMRNKDHSNSASGPDYFGFTSSTIAKLIQDLPNAKKCKNYKWQKFETTSGRSLKKTTLAAKNELLKKGKEEKDEELSKNNSMLIDEGKPTKPKEEVEEDVEDTEEMIEDSQENTQEEIETTHDGEEDEEMDEIEEDEEDEEEGGGGEEGDYKHKKGNSSSVLEISSSQDKSNSDKKSENVETDDTFDENEDEIEVESTLSESDNPTKISTAIEVQTASEDEN
ncbi:FYRC-domain-containing protein [Piromyces finnis]|uniref:FYRC-domain-containing protein n=1 Tax=Piromyces finnis TaxID=1754191 RepID=A0A1Y1V7N6_9FUNG|nr:FYRC-domain-containing protein [Piromyces finnis]|eukprot:ORX49249.1 FYRC-domain-containing protein [Piromyces finnis]